MVDDGLLNRSDQGTEVPRRSVPSRPHHLRRAFVERRGIPRGQGDGTHQRRQIHLCRTGPLQKGPKAKCEAPLGHFTFRCPLPQISLNPRQDRNPKDHRQ